MGQKTDYNPQEWAELQEKQELELFNSEISLPADFFKGVAVNKSSADNYQDSQASDSLPLGLDEAEITAYIGGEKVQFKHQKVDGAPASQEEEAFRRQIEDLFELLELEKESHSTEDVRVYQTDSSPSRPWRFH